MSVSDDMADVSARVEQVQAILSLWLGNARGDTTEGRLIGSVLTILDGIPDCARRAEGALIAYEAFLKAGK
ncbi:hypothetical protein KGP25_17505 [Enterobacter sp. JBIWA003]|uniref:hypothetical protein n=1 Tax=Enterobacter sp. JBIWA003 TaxID=2831890 RepID=UPI001CBB01F3|nr:hypothetical protein [Enterobacter sp. JBIWA003]UAN20960.1 hypothetical protein KGP25_17505 [Enterobacter sp. JBIWA003]